MKIIDCSRFETAKAFAEKLGGKSLESWNRCIDNLMGMEGREQTFIELHNDGVQHSFIWVWKTIEDKQIMVGGMILHGFQETFSVEIDPKNYPHWSIHS